MKSAILVLFLFCGVCLGQASDRSGKENAALTFEKATICQLQETPAAFNHKRIEVTAFVSHGFEDSAIFEPGCSSRFGIWMEYGGTESTATMYCCGFTPKPTRLTELIVEGIQLQMVENENFKILNKLLHKDYGQIARGTFRGTFFSGKQTTYSSGKSFWGGYGHMGCCSLFVIQEVTSVFPHDVDGLDYASAVDQPDLDKERCGNFQIHDADDWNTLLDQKHQADDGTDTWRYDAPEKVASEALSKLLKKNMGTIKLEEIRRTPGRIVYYWRPNGRKGVRYMIVVNRPYLLSLQAKVPAKTIWTVAQMYSVCN